MYKFYLLWDQYTDSIVPPVYVTGWCCACYFVGFDLSVNNLSGTFCSQLCQSSNIWWYLLAIKWAENDIIKDQI